MSTKEHKENAPSVVHCKIITVSDTRNRETDKSGRLMVDLLCNAGHKIMDYKIVKDEAKLIADEVLKGCGKEDINAVLINGGTGIAKRDVTIETVQEMFDKEITGFGELFRMLSYQEDIGSAALMSRATAGVIKDTAVFSTPGSTGAVKLAMNRLILPELGHIIREIKKDL
ncbi:MogA/MoaB family molybdenum cofactor biosynthesis protein [Bacillus massilinigeriensis]|uniref:MogA/MoaB family molybdenum cofactor biosynthesis protein n=1 Tax=Bacillus mediterraneensis TaxID=1805474 RepID=UPI0008F8C3C7|nr:molybdenum cofactor biosynthesis protein B [Bacillus mediterraneensis]